MLEKFTMLYDKKVAVKITTVITVVLLSMATMIPLMLIAEFFGVDLHKNSGINLKVDYEENVSEPGLTFAQKMADLYNVADTYVMDVCETFDGWKIIEVNCINSAGFYKADVKKIVLALEEFYE